MSSENGIFMRKIQKHSLAEIYPRLSVILSSSFQLQRCYIIHKSAHKYILLFRQVRYNFGMNKVWSYKTVHLAKSNHAGENYIGGFKIKSASRAIFQAELINSENFYLNV